MGKTLLASKLREYTVAQRAVASFRKEHSDVFSEEATLQAVVSQCETELKQVAREILTPVHNRYFGIKVVEKTSRWYDADNLIKLVPWAADLTKLVADRDAVDKLVKAGSISQEVARQVERREALTPAIVIEKRQNLV